MSLASQISALATRVGTEFKTLRATLGANTDLATTTKSTLVAAINEVNTKATTSEISDAAPSTTKAYSSSNTDQRITNAVAQVKADLVNGAPGALDTLGEIATQLASDESGAAALAAGQAQRLRLDAAGGYTTVQQQQGRDNLSVYSQAQIGDPTTDFVAAFNTAIQ